MSEKVALEVRRAGWDVFSTLEKIAKAADVVKIL